MSFRAARLTAVAHDAYHASVNLQPTPAKTCVTYAWRAREAKIESCFRRPRTVGEEPALLQRALPEEHHMSQWHRQLAGLPGPNQTLPIRSLRACNSPHAGLPNRAVETDTALTSEMPAAPGFITPAAFGRSGGDITSRVLRTCGARVRSTPAPACGVRGDAWCTPSPGSEPRST